jgi:hypothetical protein
MEAELKKALQRIDQLEKEKAVSSAQIDQVQKSVQASRGALSALNPAIGMAIYMTAEHRAKAGGDFNFRAAELGIAASIDPYARAYAFFTGSKDEFEVEEAAMVRPRCRGICKCGAGVSLPTSAGSPSFIRMSMPSSTRRCRWRESSGESPRPTASS